MTGGRQPVDDDGRLVCLECGNAYRLMAPHLARAHEMSTAEYRAAHQLPRQLSLRSEALNERAREKGKQRYANRPDIREALADGHRHSSREGATEASRETANHALVREARRLGGQGHAAAARTRIDAAAREHGYGSIEDYFQARSGSTVAEMARELRVARSTVHQWMERSKDTDLLTELVEHLIDLADGGPGDPKGATWRAAAPRLAVLEERLTGPTADRLLAEAPESRPRRMAAYLAALLLHGGDRQAAVEAAGVLPRSVTGWTYAVDGWTPAEEAVHDLALQVPAHHLPMPGVPLTEHEVTMFLSTLKQGLAWEQAARATGRSLNAFLELRRNSPEFEAAWKASWYRNRRPPAKVDEARYQELWDRGLNVAEIARELDVSYTAARYRLRKMGLHKPSPRRPAAKPQP
ncbi:MucR family transcriptional regulator [Streptomyces xiamenensis]